MVLNLAYTADEGGDPVPWNETRWLDDEFDELLKEANGTLDLACLCLGSFGGRLGSGTDVPGRTILLNDTLQSDLACLVDFVHNDAPGRRRISGA